MATIAGSHISSSPRNHRYHSLAFSDDCYVVGAVIESDASWNGISRLHTVLDCVLDDRGRKPAVLHLVEGMTTVNSVLNRCVGVAKWLVLGIRKRRSLRAKKTCCLAAGFASGSAFNGTNGPRCSGFDRASDRCSDRSRCIEPS